MSGALSSLHAWGWAFTDAVIAVGAAILAVMVAYAAGCALGGRCSGWRRRRGERRYMRAGLRDLERYLCQPLPRAAPPRRPGHGEAGQHRDGRGDR